MFTDFKFVVWDDEFVADSFAVGFEGSAAQSRCSLESDRADRAIRPARTLETDDFETTRTFAEGDMVGIE